MRQNREFTTKLDRLLGLLEREAVRRLPEAAGQFCLADLRGNKLRGGGGHGNCGLLVTLDGLHAVTTNIEAPRMREEEKLEDGLFRCTRAYGTTGSSRSGRCAPSAGRSPCKGLWAGETGTRTSRNCAFP